MIDLRIDVVPGVLPERRHLDFIAEMPYVCFLFALALCLRDFDGPAQLESAARRRLCPLVICIDRIAPSLNRLDQYVRLEYQAGRMTNAL